MRGRGPRRRSGLHIAVVDPTVRGGSGGYVKHLGHVLPGMADSSRVDRIVLLSTDRGACDAWTGDRRRWDPGGPFAGARLRAELQDLDPDVVFVPTARTLGIRRSPVVCMVRNMVPLADPLLEYRTLEKGRNVARKLSAWRATMRATRVIAVSEYVREVLIRTWAVDPSRIAVIPHGAEPAADGEPVRVEVPTPSLFTAGAIRVARGFNELILALARLGRQGLRPRVFVAGEEGPGSRGYLRHLQRLADRHDVGSQLTWLGRLDGDRMSAYYAACQAFVMTSRTEACPNVLLEAMWHGCTIVSTTARPMPDFLGDAGLYYQGGSPHDLAATLGTALALPDAAVRRYRDAAEVRARRFTWDATVRSTIDVLEAASHSQKER